MTIDSSLTSFLKASKNSRAREFLLTSRVIHDLTVAAATRNYALSVYVPTVDADGFDLILDDRDFLLRLQLKSVISSGRASEWAIHRKLLRPLRGEAEMFGFEESPEGEGQGGGVLLVEIKPNNNSIDVIYHYTDIRILTALWLRLIKCSEPSFKRLERLRKELMNQPKGNIKVPRSAFVKPISTEHLLAVAGLHSRISKGLSWPSQLHNLASHVYQNKDLSDPIGVVRDRIQNSLKNLIVMP